MKCAFCFLGCTSAFSALGSTLANVVQDAHGSLAEVHATTPAALDRDALVTDVAHRPELSFRLRTRVGERHALRDEVGGEEREVGVDLVFHAAADVAAREPEQPTPPAGGIHGLRRL